ncbi:hypothetical protein FVB32_04510 [Flagellimonas hymeniacidonis]|uniref:Uncharacterized protein n=1 Tax=Flagellimonas hymeniacidonis TaxID=2603628 RepID=A0A5C8V870_9FLAO|nr:hypothetical protein [Flagellimonas hymeniacidonis]TXN37556.1 hypothetical protein FVB32_04510 [Flagellimonas hymeniacidonis]
MGTLKHFDLTINSENVFNKDEYGKPISEDLSVILRRNTSKTEYADIAMRTNVSFSTIRDVVYRTNSLTKANAEAISLLIHAAFENAIAYKLQAEGDSLFLDDLLKV